MTIGDRIRKKRESLKLSGEQLGRMIKTDKKPDGVGKQAVSHWETGKNELTASQLLQLCEIFNVSADYLLFGNENQLSQDAIRMACSYDALDETKKNAIAGMIRSYGPPPPTPSSPVKLRKDEQLNRANKKQSSGSS